MPTTYPTFIAAWEDIVNQRPDNVFISVPVPQSERYLTYDIASFYRRAQRVGIALQEQLKLKEGSRVVILTESPNEMALLLHGIWLARMVAVPVPLEMSNEQMMACLEGSEIGAVIFPLEAAARIASLFGILRAVEHWIVTGNVAVRTGGNAVRKLDDLLAAAAGGRLRGGDDLQRDVPALVTMTQGRAAKPKVVLFRQSQLLKAAASASHLYHLSNAEKEVSWTLLPRKLYTGLMHSYVVPLINDIPAVLSTNFDVRKFWEQVLADGITFALMDQHQLRNVLKKGKARTWRQPQNLKIGLVTDTPWSAELIATFEKRFNVPLFTCYSQTEAGGVITALQPDAQVPDPKPVIGGLYTSGTTISGNEFKIVDADGRELGEQERGEIVIKTTQIMSGYINTTGVEAKKKDATVLHTGDEGFYLVQGGSVENKHLFVTGRMEDVITRKGRRISLALTDAYLYEINGVDFGITVGFRHSSLGQEVGAYVIPMRASNLTEVDVLEALRSKVAPAESPKVVIFGERPKSGIYPRRSELTKLFQPYYDSYFSE